MPSRTQPNRFWSYLSNALLILCIIAQAAFFVGVLCSFAGYDLFRDAPQTVQAKPVHRAARGVTLRHIIHHGAGQPGPRARRLDITADRVSVAAAAGQYGPFPIRTAPVKIERPAVQDYFNAQTPMSPIWIAEDFQGPDVEDKETVLNFAYMSEDAYKAGRDDPEWLDVDEQYNSTIPFGWDDMGVWALK